MATTRNPSKTKTGNGSFARSDGKDNFPKERELIVVAKRDVGLRVAGEGLTSAEGANVKPLSDLLAAEGAEMAPLFGLSEERLKAEAAALAPSSEMEVPDLSILYHVRAEDEKLDKLCKALCELDFVDGAYVKPAGEPPEVLVEDTIETVNDMLPIGDEAPPATANLSTRQGYLDPAPGGIDARYAWTIAGGRGAGIRIIDCEWGWRFTHEDLLQNQMGVVFGSSSSSDNHGTAVLGEISGDRNAFGVLGIAPDAIVGAASFVSSPSAQTIRQAANRLNAGDIILLEIHRPGPRATGVGQQGFIAIEWWYDDFLAIRYAASRGIIVVEAAGNGAQNFDDGIYDVRPAGFPAAWRNPFNPGNPSSGAVVVGAGAPPPGTHGRNHGPDRSRLGFSNYGRRVDVQGWGREVTTTGYGDLQGGGNRDFWYTDTFSGTSSASPIVVCARLRSGRAEGTGRNPSHTCQCQNPAKNDRLTAAGRADTAAHATNRHSAQSASNDSVRHESMVHQSYDHQDVCQPTLAKRLCSHRRPRMAQDQAYRTGRRHQHAYRRLRSVCEQPARKCVRGQYVHSPDVCDLSGIGLTRINLNRENQNHEFLKHESHADFCQPALAKCLRPASRHRLEKGQDVKQRWRHERFYHAERGKVAQPHGERHH